MSDEPISPPPSKISLFASFGLIDYRWLFAGSTAFYMAMNMQIITRGWLILRLTNDSPLALSIVMLSFGMPLALLSPLGGALADRFSKKKLIVISQIGNAVFTSVLALLDMTGQVQYWHLIATGMINGSLMALNLPSRQVLISEVTPKHLLMNAISLANSTMNLTRIIGPALAGFLIVYLDTWGVFFIITGFYLTSGLSIAFIKRAPPRTGPQPLSIFKDIREGFVHAARTPTIRTLIMLLLVPAIFGFGLSALLPVWAKTVLGVNSDGLGVLFMINGLGALVGSLILASISGITNRGRLLLVVGVLWAICLALFGRSSAYNTALPLLFLIGLMNSSSLALNMTLIQTYAEDRMRARVVSISTMIFGGAPLGVVPLGILAEHIGTANTLSVCGLVLICGLTVFALANRSYGTIQ